MQTILLLQVQVISSSRGRLAQLLVLFSYGMKSSTVGEKSYISYILNKRNTQVRSPLVTLNAEKGFQPRYLVNPREYIELSRMKIRRKDSQ